MRKYKFNLNNIYMTEENITIPYTFVLAPVTAKQQQLRRCTKCNKFFSAWKSSTLYPDFFSKEGKFKCYHCEKK